MPQREHSPDEIRVLEYPDCVRSRPAMYFGELTSPDAVNLTLLECLCLALDNSNGGCATDIQITINADGSVVVWDDGPGVDVQSGSHGMTELDAVFSMLMGCRHRKSTDELKESLCHIGMAPVNAVCTSLTYETAQSGYE